MILCLILKVVLHCTKLCDLVYFSVVCLMKNNGNVFKMATLKMNEFMQQATYNIITAFLQACNF
jgi:hypothetical protein